LHRGIAEDVVGVPMRVEDLHETQALFADGVDDLSVTHRRIDDDRLVPGVDDEIAAVVVRRYPPRDDPDHARNSIVRTMPDVPIENTAPAVGVTQGRPAILAPNIDLAEGFPVYPRLARAIAMLEERLRGWPTSAAVFLMHGRAPRVGEILVQKDLAALFRLLVQTERSRSALGRAGAIMAARDVIYEGFGANLILGSQTRYGGMVTERDLAEYHVSIAPPVHTTYRGIDVYACGPWSQGPLVPMTLNLLEPYDVASMGPGSLAFLHTYTEAFKLAAADR